MHAVHVKPFIKIFKKIQTNATEFSRKSCRNVFSLLVVKSESRKYGYKDIVMTFTRRQSEHWVIVVKTLLILINPLFSSNMLNN